MAPHPPIEGIERRATSPTRPYSPLTERPERLAVIGAGPIGCELAQTFQRLGCQVVLFHNGGHILNREDADAAEIVQQQFLKEGIQLVLNSALTRVTTENGRKVVHYEAGGNADSVAVDEILVEPDARPTWTG